MAVAIMGIAFAAILGAFGTTIRGSDYHRKSADIQAALQAVTQQVKADSYIACAGANAYTFSGVSSELHVDQLAATYWDNSSGTFTSTCSATAMQRVTVRVCLASVAGSGTCPVTTSGTQELTTTKLQK